MRSFYSRLVVGTCTIGMTLGVATAYGVVYEGRPYPERWTFIIGTDGAILDIITEVDAGTHGKQLAERLEALGVAWR